MLDDIIKELKIQQKSISELDGSQYSQTKLNLFYDAIYDLESCIDSLESVNRPYI